MTDWCFTACQCIFFQNPTWVCYIFLDGVVSFGQRSRYQPAKRLRSHTSFLCLQVMSLWFITEYSNMSVVCAFNRHHRHTVVFNIVIGLQPWPKRHSTDSSLSGCQISCWQEWNYSSGSVCAGGLFTYFHWVSVMGFVFTKLHVYDLGWIWGNLWDPHSASQQTVPNTHPDDTERWY